MSEAPATSIPVKKRRVGRWFLAAVLISLVVFHAPILRGVGEFLVIDASFQAGDLLVVRNDPESLTAAAQFFQSGTYDQILLQPNRPRRTDELGITESTIDEARRELRSRGVPEERIEAVGAAHDGLTDRVREICTSIQDRPGRRVALVALQYEGAAVQRLVRTYLPTSMLEQVAVTSQPSPQFDGRRWWTSRRGVQSVFRGYLTWLLVVCRGGREFEEQAIDWNAVEAAIARGEKP